ncbi:hypothetical protein NDU88_006596, partial [Pleurodeles waltl]
GQIQDAHAGVRTVSPGPRRLDGGVGCAGHLFPYLYPAGPKTLPTVQAITLGVKRVDAELHYPNNCHAGALLKIHPDPVWLLNLSNLELDTGSTRMNIAK